MSQAFRGLAWPPDSRHSVQRCWKKALIICEFFFKYYLCIFPALYGKSYSEWNRDAIRTRLGVYDPDTQPKCKADSPTSCESWLASARIYHF
jgi:hypothetical protein